MVLVKTIKELKKQLNALREKGSVGFVPTMGALHSGHISLVNQAVHENQVVVVSIFVNPNQFNDASDLKRYPRNLEADLKLLEPTGCDLVFAPEAEEIYPEPDTRIFDFGPLEQVMEGKHRPGHFNGVAQVVSRLFEIVKPDKAYLGLKDFQQLAIINQLVRMLKLPVEIVPCNIIREKNGLAMSSRNELLTADERGNAALIFKTLLRAKNLAGTISVRELKNEVIETINKNPFLNVEYFEIVDFENLQPVKSWSEKGKKIGCIAVFCGKVRLIDNIVLN
ncbi:pantoate--beta-alanine ligase [Mariniphaga sp.]|uniref:pantoate--beta-alanine ligase n=1 Tax=Mariniphaga sp. TaxID=1954475 RepID=UPI00356490D2